MSEVETETGPLEGDTLEAALGRHGVSLTERQMELVQGYAELLWEWNTKMNLTRHTDWEKFVGRDVVDSLRFAHALGKNERVLDVGAGGGVPGVMLAVLRPDAEVTMLDSVGKKVSVVRDIAKCLGLPARSVHDRIEKHLADNTYTTCTARAVAPLPKLLGWFKPHWNHVGRLLAMKGPAWTAEAADAERQNLLRGLHLTLVEPSALDPAPGPEAERTTVLLEISPRSGR